ncbi:pentapeptide repeat-containing protein [Brevibacillus borstelensis]|uniref:pentapeptide repeat-containing protein n=1 Tax=Brevibacillus borstelensis TaxID=45462 RepID=UPI0030BEA9FF
MKSLLDLVAENIGFEKEGVRLFLKAINNGQELNQFILEKMTNNLVLAKNPKALSKQALHLSILVAMEVAQDDIYWENEDTVKVTKAKLFNIIDGNTLIRKYGQDLDLAFINLRGAQLKGADLRGVNLNNSDLQGADLERANLKGSSLIGTNLQGCNLTEANLFGANLTKADLRRANLRRAELRKAILNGTALRGAELWGANIWGIDLKDSFSEGVDLSRADTRGS